MSYTDSKLEDMKASFGADVKSLTKTNSLDG